MGLEMGHERLFGKDVFILDVTAMGWREKNSPLNLIERQHLQDMGSHYEFYYDPDIKRDITVPPGHPKMDRLVHISVPQLVQVAPGEVATLYGIGVNELPARDSLLRGNPARIERRANGQLPRVEIGNTIYEFDYDETALLRRGKSIPLEDMDNDLDGGFSFLYDLKKHEVATLEPGFTEIGKDLVLVVIPSTVRMDPFSWAQEWQQSPKRLISEFPQPDLFRAYQVPAGEHFPLLMQLAQNKMEAENKRPDPIKPIAPPLPDPPGKRHLRRRR